MNKIKQDLRKFMLPQIGEVYFTNCSIIKFGGQKKSNHYCIIAKKRIDDFFCFPCTSQKSNGIGYYLTNLHEITIPKTGRPHVQTCIILKLSIYIPIKEINTEYCKYVSYVKPDEFKKIMNAYAQFIQNSQNKAKRQN